MEQTIITREFIELLIDLIDNQDAAQILELVKDFHSSDFAALYDELEVEQVRYLLFLLDKETAGDVLVELEDDEREEFLENIPAEEIVEQFINEMDSDDAADIIGDLPEHRQEEILSKIKDLEQAGDIVDLLNYDEDSAGGLMAKEFIRVEEDWNVGHCIEEIRENAEDVEEIYFVYVTDSDNVLRGIISLKTLILNDWNQPILELIDRDVKSVKTDADAETVANIMEKYDLVALPVVDSIGRLVGRITIDDVVDVIREAAEKDYQMISGITSDVESSDKIWPLTRARLPWLLIGLVGGVFGSRVLELFEGELGLYPQLIFFIPLIASMAGNVGIQSSSIIVQGLASNTLGLESTPKKLMKELMVGLMNGIITASLLFGYNMLSDSSMDLTVAVSLSLMSVILFASLFGTMIPLFLNKVNVDPALATGPFITTINDIMSALIYLNIGKIIFEANLF
ncbi:MAG: magnesium transporter [Bacteroidales bacterium]|nr:magnesium transporter [Bacteroidales bacterium]